MAMKVLELLNEKNRDPYHSRPVTIGFLGDSVTNGCFEVLPGHPDDGEMAGEVYYDIPNSYSAKLYRILNTLYPRAQINIINAGISGDAAHGGLSRMERDLLPYKPDLTVVCFGANDCCGGEEGLPRFHDSLVEIIRKLREAGSEVILMTQHTICTQKHTMLQGKFLREFADKLIEIFNSGMYDRYVNTMRQVAEEENVPLCDANAKWMAMLNAGVEVNSLLSNYLNHPTRDLHWLFAYSLVDTIFGV